MEQQADLAPADDEEEEEILPIDDDRVPAAVRELALCYRTPVAYVVIGSGDDSVALFCADGHAVDLVKFKPPRRPLAGLPLPGGLLLIGLVVLIVLYPVAAFVWRTVEALVHKPGYWPIASLLLGVIALSTFLALRLNRILR